MTLSDLQRALTYLGASNLRVSSLRDDGDLMWSATCEWRGEVVDSHEYLLESAVVDLLGQLSVKVEKLWERVDAEKKGQSK